MVINLHKEFKKCYIPYKGSKNAIAYDLMCQMAMYKPRATRFIDLFGGGGAMSFLALEMGYSVVYNEYNEDLSNFVLYVVNRIKSGEKGNFGLFEDNWYVFVTKEIFLSQLQMHTPYSTFCKIVYSFGNNGRNYLFNQDIEKIKHIAHDIVVFQNLKQLIEFNKIIGVTFAMPTGNTIFTRRKNYLLQLRLSKKRIDLEQLERLEQLEQLEQLQQLQQLQQLEIKNQSYEELNINYNDENVIVYCDSPYRGTDEYGKAFDFVKFDNWLKHHDKTIFLSEYSAPFKPIFEIKKRCTLSSTNNTIVRTERLYCNKNIDVIKSNRLQLSLF